MTHGGGSSDDQVANKQRAERLRMRTPKREKSRHEPIEVRINRHSSKPRSGSGATAAGSSSLESKRSSHHSRHSREVDHSSETKTSSSSRLMRSSRVADDSRPRQSSHRDREKERDRERSRGTEKHREELTRSRGRLKQDSCPLDGKPPPTQNFRRRRRTTTASGPLQSLVKSASAGCSGGGTTTQTSEVTHFGDPVDRRKTIATSTVAYRATLMDPPEVVSQPVSTLLKKTN